MKRKILFSLLTIVLVSFSNIAFSNDYLRSYRLLKNDSIQAKVEYQSVQFKMGFNIGWEFPYAVGVEGSLLFDEMVDINMGFGIGMSGVKIGFGSRFFPIRNKKVSPMIGAYYYHASGINSINVSVNKEEGEYKITADNALLLNTGMRFRFGKGHYLMAGIGYSFPFKGDKAQYKSGSNASAVQSFADAISVGGFSMNVGILIKLSSGYYRKIN